MQLALGIIAALAVIAAATIPAVIADRRASRERDELKNQVAKVHQENRDDHANVWLAVVEVAQGQGAILEKLDAMDERVDEIHRHVVVVDHRADNLEGRVHRLEEAG